MTSLTPLSARLRGIPLRVKLVASVLALVAAALVVISVSTTLSLRRNLIGQVDTELRTLVNGLQFTAAQRSGGQFGLPTDYLVVLTDQTTGEIESIYYDQIRFTAAELPPWPESAAGFIELQGEPFTVRARESKIRWRMLYTALPNGQMAAVGQHLFDVDEAMKQLIWTDLLVGAAVLLTLASVGAGIVRTSLRPLVQIEQTAGAIAAGDLTRRVPDPEPGAPQPQTELGRLSRALNAMLTQIEVAFTARAASEMAARSAEAAARDAAFAAQTSEGRARRSEERMRQFVADASHELRTPLTTIRGFAELYRQGAVSSAEDVSRLLRRIEDEAARMGLLVEELLLLARLDRERPLALTPVELPVLATEAVQAAQAVAPERRIDLEIAPDSGPLVVSGDDARLRQVLGNLLTNALTHTPPEATVTVRLRAEPADPVSATSSTAAPSATAVLEVADTGPGLSSEQAERVFERFYRADAARTRRADGATGAGLGLAIVAALVAAHQGTVEVGETPGGGATFRVRLPLTPVAPEAGADPISHS